MVEQGRLGPIEWAAAGRARPGEQVCGDQSIAVDVGPRQALFGVLDGLGHGEEAAMASQAAAQVLRDNPAEPFDGLLRLCHRALADTRGAAITLARIDYAADTLSLMGIGNVTADLVAKRSSGVEVRASARLTGGIVGFRIPELPATQEVSMSPGDLLILATDGIAEDHLGGIDFAASATVIAEQTLGRFSKDTDDALVLAVRHRGHVP